MNPVIAARRDKMKSVLARIVEYYGADTKRRSVSPNGFCRYQGPDGQVCAFALCCQEDRLGDLNEGESADFILETLGTSVLLPKYHDLSNSGFWVDVQGLHDVHNHWTPDGLSLSGHLEVKSILESIDSGVYDTYPEI